MKVLMLTTDLRLGGVERTIINRVHCLREAGIECAVAGLFERTAGGGKARELLEKAGFPVFCAGIERKRDVWRFVRLWRFVEGWRPDLVHAHMFHGHLAGALLRLRGWRGPMVWSYHSTVPLPLRNAFYRLFSPPAAAHVFVSEAVRSFQRRWARRTQREEVIYNGIELRPYLALEPQPGPVFGALGRLVPEKGFDVLIRAFARLCRENDEVTLRIAGDGPERGALEELARVEGAADRVEFVGFVDDVAGFLSRVNVFVNPSRSEAFGNTLVEGMAAGLPCIAARVGGLPEVGGELVHWVEPEDVDGLCRAMRRMIGAPQSPERIARQRQAVEPFSREAMAQRYLELYRSLLA